MVVEELIPIAGTVQQVIGECQQSTSYLLYEYLKEAAVSVIASPNAASRVQPGVNANSDSERGSLIRIIENLVDGFRPGCCVLRGSWGRWT